MIANTDVPATIFALASGAGRSGIAVIRLSGPWSRFACETIAGACRNLAARAWRPFRSGTGEIIDRGLLIVFPGPASFTGEDVAEFHVHGGRAVVAGMLDALALIARGCARRERGEFTRRAVENGQLDLTAAKVSPI